jgi:hypothetical protein
MGGLPRSSDRCKTFQGLEPSLLTCEGKLRKFIGSGFLCLGRSAPVTTNEELLRHDQMQLYPMLGC